MSNDLSSLFCNHPTVKLVYLKNSTEIYCKSCEGYLTEYRNDLPEARNFDKMIARRLYVIPPVWNLTDEQLKKWV